ncbi:MAG TPA: aminotransferase, partial [Marinobacter hydrocarbonoclasticus]|nr:aminotransferase [Marinobacter nauticus]
MLAQLEQLELERYPLLRDEAWRPDLGALRRSLREHARLRIIVVVNPGNPTGAFLRS